MTSTETGFVAGHGRETALLLLKLSEEAGYDGSVVRRARNGYTLPADVVEAYEAHTGRDHQPTSDEVAGIEDTSNEEREAEATASAKENSYVTKSDEGKAAKSDATVAAKHDAPATVDEAKDALADEAADAAASVGQEPGEADEATVGEGANADVKPAPKSTSRKSTSAKSAE